MKKIFLGSGVALFLIGLIANLSTYAEYKHITTFIKFQKVYLTSWFNTFIILGIIVLVISLFIKKK
jgi:hypothetical protein